MALYAAHDEPGRERAAPAILHGVRERVDGARLADDAVVDAFAALLELLDDAHGPVDGRAFLIGGEEKRDRARMLRALGDERFRGDDERGDGGLHVRRAAPVELAVTDRGHEGIGMPFGQRPGRHHIGVAGEADDGLRGTAARPEILHGAERHRLAAESGPLEPCGDEALATPVFRGDGLARDELFRELQSGARACSARLRHSCRS
jgi:hypothetical protein